MKNESGERDGKIKVIMDKEKIHIATQFWRFDNVIKYLATIDKSIGERKYLEKEAKLDEGNIHFIIDILLEKGIIEITESKTNDKLQDYFGTFYKLTPKGMSIYMSGNYSELKKRERQEIKRREKEKEVQDRLLELSVKNENWVYKNRWWSIIISFVGAVIAILSLVLTQCSA